MVWYVQKPVLSHKDDVAGEASNSRCVMFIPSVQHCFRMKVCRWQNKQWMIMSRWMRWTWVSARLVFPHSSQPSRQWWKASLLNDAICVKSSHIKSAHTWPTSASFNKYYPVLMHWPLKRNTNRFLENIIRKQQSFVQFSQPLLVWDRMDMHINIHVQDLSSYLTDLSFFQHWYW